MFQQVVAMGSGRTGTTHGPAQMRSGGLEPQKVLRSMEPFAAHVMPALREEEAKMAVAEEA